MLVKHDHMKMKQFILIFLLLTLTFTPVHADDFQEGLDAYNQKDFKAALIKWKPLAERGVKEAQHNLGLIFEKGLGVIQDYTEAIKFYRMAAERGFAKAQLRLGLIYAKKKILARGVFSPEEIEEEGRNQISQALVRLRERISQETNFTENTHDQADAIDLKDKQPFIFERAKRKREEMIRLLRISKKLKKTVSSECGAFAYERDNGSFESFKKYDKCLSKIAIHSFLSDSRSQRYKLRKKEQIVDRAEYLLKRFMKRMVYTQKLFAQEQTEKESWKWLTLAAEQDLVDAQLNLGHHYWGRDLVQAHKWFNIAESNESENARIFRDAIEKKMTPDKIAEAQILAREWMERHK